jgi:hypothetical protein
MLKILINCPGGWSHGLDSPERGEGRWAQNFARCLAKSGKYDVSACSGGNPTWGAGDVVKNVSLLTERAARQRGPFDLYFDASWYDKKVPAADARHNFHVHFGYEPRLGVPFPPGHYIIYVLAQSGHKYYGEGRNNTDRTMYLPAPFGEQMLPPDPSRRRIVHTMRGADAPGRVGRFEQIYEVATRLRQEGMEVPFTWISSPGLESPRHAQDHVIKPQAAWGIPYNQIRAELRNCGLNAALDGWSSMLDCTSLGVPSLTWTGGIDVAATAVAAKHGLDLHNGDSTDRIAEVIGRLFRDPQLYYDYTRDLQATFADHIEAVTLQKLEEIIKRVGA